MRKSMTKTNTVNFMIILDSTYRTSFIPKETAVCKSKIQLEAKMRESFAKTKDRFTENTDFKALSQDFHAISTSKHWYV